MRCVQVVHVYWEFVLCKMNDRSEFDRKSSSERSKKRTKRIEMRNGVGAKLGSPIESEVNSTSNMYRSNL